MSMIVFFGLGNNEAKYFKTKHNAGRLLLEKLAHKEALSFQKNEKYSFCKTKWSGEEVFFVYSNGYMNLSGEALTAFLKYFKLDLSGPNDYLVVLQDDSDQIEGNNKLVIAGGSAGHRGIDSIYKQISSFNLDTQHLWRLKIGIRPNFNTQKSETFVLTSLSDTDIKNIDSLTVLTYDNKALFSGMLWDKIQMKVNTKSQV